MILTTKEQQEINELAQQFEAASGAQAVAAVVGKADDYPDIPWKAFALGAGLAALAVVAEEFIHPDWASIHTPLRDVAAILAVGVISALAAAYLPGFARLLLNRERAATEVRQYAEGIFLQRELFRTAERVGILIAPKFKAGKFDEGLDEGVAVMIGQLEGKGADALPSPGPSAAQSGIKGPNLSLTERILFGVFIFGIIGLFTVIGVATPGMGWFLYVFLIPFCAMFPIVVVGFNATMAILGIYLIGFPLAKILVSRSDWFKQRSLNTPRGGRRSRMDGLNHSSGGWSSGSSAGAGSSGSSDSFSGGGGGSGGGGSSGDY